MGCVRAAKVERRGGPNVRAGWAGALARCRGTHWHVCHAPPPPKAHAHPTVWVGGLNPASWPDGHRLVKTCPALPCPALSCPQPIPSVARFPAMLGPKHGNPAPHPASRPPTHLSDPLNAASSKAPSATSSSSLFSATSTAMTASETGSSTGCSSAHIGLRAGPGRPGHGARVRRAGRGAGCAAACFAVKRNACARRDAGVHCVAKRPRLRCRSLRLLVARGLFRPFPCTTSRRAHLPPSNAAKSWVSAASPAGASASRKSRPTCCLVAAQRPMAPSRCFTLRGGGGGGGGAAGGGSDRWARPQTQGCSAAAPRIGQLAGPGGLLAPPRRHSSHPRTAAARAHVRVRMCARAPYLAHGARCRVREACPQHAAGSVH
jgi:hypothetical protein